MSTEALAKPIITKNSSEFKPDAYASIPAGELVVFAVQVVQADTAPVAVEEVVSTCFRLFPHSFALKNYFYWPDSALVTRRLHDAREKGFLKGSPAEGFETKGKGTQTAKRVAKALGVTLLIPPKVEKPEPVKAEVEPPKEVAAPVVVETVEVKQTQLPLLPEIKETPKKKPVRVAKKPQVVIKKAAPAKPKKEVKHAPAVPEKKATAGKVTSPAPKKKKPVKKMAAPEKRTPVKKAVTEKKAPEKKVVTPAPKKKAAIKKSVTTAPVKKTPVKKAVTPAPKKKTPARKVSAPKALKKAPVVKVEKKKKATPKPRSAKPAQLTMALPTPPAKKTAGGSATKLKPAKEAKTVRQESAPVAQVQVTKEEKDKAGKFVKLMERSDAYKQYRKNSGKAKISEFDFRNMLFATMESSAETLKRNVDLFKRYAGIHNRADLITFLVFCEDSFAPLLVPQAKRTTRK